MKEKDLLYVVGSIRPQDEIKKNDACFRAGFLGSKIQVQPYSQQEMQLLEAGLFKKLPVYDRVLNRKSKHVTEVEIATEHFEKLNRPPKHVREAAARIAEDYRLVNGRKSPTQKMDSRKWDIRSTLRVLGRVLRTQLSWHPLSHISVKTCYMALQAKVLLPFCMKKGSEMMMNQN
ncbi:hypothetical protein AAFX60_008790 [Aliivibrio fischeri]